MAERPRVVVVHRGRFSGCTTSTIDALTARVDVEAIDVLPWARDLRLVSARARATVISRTAPERPEWPRTEPWAEAIARRVDADIRRRRPDAAVVLQSYPLLRDPGVPYVVYTDRTVREGQRVDARFVPSSSPAWIEREAALFAGAKQILTFGSASLVSLVEDYAIPSERIEAAGVGPNDSPFPPRERTDCTRLVFVGVEWERKGGDVLLDAYAEVRAQRPDMTLEVVGCRPPTTPPGVTVVGRVKHARVRAAQRAADLHVLPSRVDAFPIAHVEAILSGLPTIGTTVGSQAEIIGDAGRVVPPDDPEALADAMLDVAEHYDAVVAATLARRDEMQTRWSWSTVATRILAGLGLADE